MKYSVILLAGGTGSRMQNSIPKQYLLLAGKPMIMHSLEKIDFLDDVDCVIIVCSEKFLPSLKLMIKQYGIKKKIEFAEAGRTRQESVFSGLKRVKTDSVIIHEAARPFVSIDDYKKIIMCDSQNAIYGLDIPFTVSSGSTMVTGLHNRSELVNVQLPQKFNTKKLLKAHKMALKEEKVFTEDSSLMFFYFPTTEIKIIKGQPYNIKITTRLDMLFGEIIYDEFFRGIK